MGLTDYTNLEKEISDAPEPHILPRGTEVKVRIVAVRSGVSDKNGATWYMPLFDVPADPLALEFNAFFWDLSDRDKLGEKQAARATTQFKNFAKCFGLDYSKPFDWETDLNGLEGWITVGVVKDDEYGDKNSVSKYLSRK